MCQAYQEHVLKTCSEKQASSLSQGQLERLHLQDSFTDQSARLHDVMHNTRSSGALDAPDASVLVLVMDVRCWCLLTLLSAGLLLYGAHRPSTHLVMT